MIYYLRKDWNRLDDSSRIDVIALKGFSGYFLSYAYEKFKLTRSASLASITNFFWTNPPFASSSYKCIGNSFVPPSPLNGST